MSSVTLSSAKFTLSTLSPMFGAQYMAVVDAAHASPKSLLQNWGPASSVTPSAWLSVANNTLSTLPSRVFGAQYMAVVEVWHPPA